MIQALKMVSRYLDQFNVAVGKGISWLTTILMVLICSDVFMRYFLNRSKAWILELEWHLFALIFLIGAAYTLKADKHVRVDVFYAKLKPKKQAWINLIGTVFLLIPWCLIIIYTSFQYAENAFAIGETSPESGGLPARYLIKFSITLGFVLLFMQAIAEIIRSLQTILDSKQDQ